MNDERRTKLANLSFSEKIKLLKQMHERSLAFAEARERLAEIKKKREY